MNSKKFVFIGWQHHEYFQNGKYFKSDIFFPLFNIIDTSRLSGSTISLKSLIDKNYLAECVQ